MSDFQEPAGEGAEPQMETIPKTFTAFTIAPKDEEEKKDERMPRECAHAMFVFVKSGINNHDNARRCKQCISETLEMLQQGPDGATKLNIGQAVICWGCGHVGIPTNYDDILRTVGKSEDQPVQMFESMPPLAICEHCSGENMTNWVIPKQPDGSILPWIQRDRNLAPSTDDKKKNEEPASK